MAARHEQIGQRASHEQAMGVLLQSAIAHLGKAEHPLDDADRMLDPGPHSGLGAVFPPLDLIDNTAVTVAANGEIPGLGRMLPDHRPLSAIDLVTPHTGLLPMQQLGRTVLSATLAGVAATAWISLLRLSTPRCAFIPKYHWLPFFVWCISGSRALSAFLVEDGALMIVASTIVPAGTFIPLATKCRCTSSNIGRPRSCGSGRGLRRDTGA